MASAEQMTKRYYEDLGYLVEDVRCWNPFSKTRKDLLGFGDLLAFRANEIVLVQATIGLDNLAKRVEKIKQNPYLSGWLKAGGYVEAIGWRKLKARKKDGTLGKRERYVPKIVDFQWNNHSIEVRVREEQEDADVSDNN